MMTKREIKSKSLKIILHLDHVYQKAIIHLQTNAEDLDVVRPMYNLLEYNDNYFIISGSLWNYYRDEVNDDENENDNAINNRIYNKKSTTSKSFEYKTKIIGRTSDNSNTLDTKVDVPLKHLSDF